MKIISKSNGTEIVNGKIQKVQKATIKMNHSEWKQMGKKAGWFPSEDRPTLENIWRGQEKIWMDDEAETMLDDFIIKAIRAGYKKDEIVQGLEEFYRQAPESGSDIFDRLVKRLGGFAQKLPQDKVDELWKTWDKQEGKRQ